MMPNFKVVEEVAFNNSLFDEAAGKALAVGLTQNYIGDEVGQVFADALLENCQPLERPEEHRKQPDQKPDKGLRILHLSGCYLGAGTGVAMAKVLRVNQSLRELRLNNNDIGDEGGVAIAQA